MPVMARKSSSPSAAAEPEVKSLGLIAGKGELPMVIASEARKNGYRVIGIALHPAADDSIRPLVDDFHRVNIGRLGYIIRTLKKQGVSEVIMAGKVPKSLLYSNKKSVIPDIRAAKVLFSLKDFSDETILGAIRRELENEGLKLLKTADFTREALTARGILTKKKPSKRQWLDIAFGWKLAKGIGRLDIGQTVVVKDRAVMSVEAIEGTDEAILRGGALAGPGAVVVKVSRPKQDMRLDVPVAGSETLSAMKKAGALVLALEAGRSIIIEREVFLREADRSGLIVAGISKEDISADSGSPEDNDA